MVSRLRMKLDLLVQGVFLTAFGLFSSLELWRTTAIVALLILGFIQIISAAQLWLWHHYRPARVYLWLFLGAAAVLPLGLHFFDSLAWLCLVAMGIAYFSHTIYMALVVLRRPRSFWDIT
ncbi:MAG: hypothetical protein SFV55_02180 [Haliscomenobacter sp.]|uniref:hypothetical protein n=1 Tax=Haliscomenobacter sp. TaxID=2717303 RepID=UPI0029A0AE8C|nr:hypothetical protein [Haliscomenobacter sp.]MDX2067200.1 hypothetical protein [Haliscomenobacter sp.]